MHKIGGTTTEWHNWYEFPSSTVSKSRVRACMERSQITDPRVHISPLYLKKLIVKGNAVLFLSGDIYTLHAHGMHQTIVN